MFPVQEETKLGFYFSETLAGRTNRTRTRGEDENEESESESRYLPLKEVGL